MPPSQGRKKSSEGCAHISVSSREMVVLHITDLHFWEVVWNPLHLLNKRFLGNINVFMKRRHHFKVDRAGEFGADAAAHGFGTDFKTLRLPQVFAG